MQKSNRPKAKKRAGRKIKAIRWTIELAASEFGFSPRTIIQRLKGAGVLPGPDHCFCTRDLVRCLFGDLHDQKIRKTAAEAYGKELANAKTAKLLVDVQDFLKRFEPIYAGIKQHVMASSMTDAEKDRLLLTLVKLHDV